MIQLNLKGKKICKYLDDGFCYYQIKKKIDHATVSKCDEDGCKLKE